jgi:hypothetical protein
MAKATYDRQLTAGRLAAANEGRAKWPTFCKGREPDDD